MNCPFASLRPARRWVLLTLLVGFMGCTSAGVPAPPVLSNILPPGVEPNASLFRQQQMRLYGRPTHKRVRRAICEHGTTRTARCVVDVEIHVDDRAALPDPDTPPAIGYAIARLTNPDPRDTEEYYHLVPSVRAEYFVWIDAMPGGRRTRWTLLYVPTGSGTVQTVMQSTLVRCHPKPGGRPANVDFSEFADHPVGSCGVTTNTVAPSVRLASAFSIAPFNALLSRIRSLVSGSARAPNGIWFECNGCCT